MASALKDNELKSTRERADLPSGKGASFARAKPRKFCCKDGTVNPRSLSSVTFNPGNDSEWESPPSSQARAARIGYEGMAAGVTKMGLWNHRIPAVAAIEANVFRHKLHPDPAKVAKNARLFDEPPARRAVNKPLGPPLPEWGNTLVLLDATPGHSPGYRHQGQHRQRQNRLGEKNKVKQSMEKHGGKEAAADCSPAAIPRR